MDCLEEERKAFWGHSDFGDNYDKGTLLCGELFHTKGFQTNGYENEILRAALGSVTFNGCCIM